MPLLTRLEHEDDGARQLVASRAQRLCRPDQHRGMRVVTTSVHRAGVAAGKGEPCFLLHRQRIHVAAQQHGAAVRPLPFRPAPAQDRDKAAGRRRVVDFERQPRQRRLRLFGRPDTVQADLGIGMDGAAQRDDVVEMVVADAGPVGRGVEIEGHGATPASPRPCAGVQSRAPFYRCTGCRHKASMTPSAPATARRARCGTPNRPARRRTSRPAANRHRTPRGRSRWRPAARSTSSPSA